MEIITDEYVEVLRERVRGKKYCEIIIKIQDGKLVHTKVTQNFKEE